MADSSNEINKQPAKVLCQPLGALGSSWMHAKVGRGVWDRVRPRVSAGEHNSKLHGAAAAPGAEGRPSHQASRGPSHRLSSLFLYLERPRCLYSARDRGFSCSSQALFKKTIFFGFFLYCSILFFNNYCLIMD